MACLAQMVVYGVRVTRRRCCASIPRPTCPYFPLTASRSRQVQVAARQPASGWHDGCIPSARRPYQIDCTSDPPIITEMGGPHPGDWKWHGAVLSPYDNCIYGIPQFAESVLKIDPQTQTTSEIGGPFPGASPTGKHKWYGGLLGGDGCIYGIPQCATSVLKIDPFTQTATMMGSLEAGGWKWHGGVTGKDGCIYGIPANADSVLRSTRSRRR